MEEKEEDLKIKKFNLEKDAQEEKLLQETRKKQQITYKGIPVRLSTDFQQKLCRLEGLAGYI